jgi:hypothetical protein
MSDFDYDDWAASGTEKHGPFTTSSNMSVSTVYLAAIIGMFFLAAAFHPSEAHCLVHGTATFRISLDLVLDGFEAMRADLSYSPRL